MTSIAAASCLAEADTSSMENDQSTPKDVPGGFFLFISKLVGVLSPWGFLYERVPIQRPKQK